MIAKELLEVLACPQCKGPVELKGIAGESPDKPNEALECNACRLRYRIEDGIPVMLIDEAEKIPD